MTCRFLNNSTLLKVCQRQFSRSTTPHRRHRGLRPPAGRLARFGSYELLLPGPANLSGQILKTAWRPVPESIPRPQYNFETGEPSVLLSAPHIKDETDIVKMRNACQLARHVLEVAKAHAKAGTTTLDIDGIVHEEILQHGAYPSPLGYMQYPRSLCTSVNNVICHGIPDSRELRDGDLVNLDVTVSCFHGDNSETVAVGNVDEKGLALMAHTKEAMERAIAICRPGVAFAEIGALIESYAEEHGYTTNSDFSGHGIGRQFHEPPMIYHFRNDEPGIMEKGMTFTIEPMLCQGVAEPILWPDRWTAVTADGGRSAQYEHTVLITEEGCEILTRQ
ncbi:peptidase M24, structural domain-containing protein [Gaertneriomyces semiglobifer]|nr:peptidase M24, structural domain-containing protein [Gaertneriomyces semiglobifer]